MTTFYGVLDAILKDTLNICEMMLLLTEINIVNVYTYSYLQNKFQKDSQH